MREVCATDSPSPAEGTLVWWSGLLPLTSVQHHTESSLPPLILDPGQPRPSHPRGANLMICRYTARKLQRR